MQKLAEFMGTSGFVVGLVIWKGYVLSILWKWFIVAVFVGVPLLTIPQAIGLSLLATLIHPRTGAKSDGKSLGETMASAFIGTLIVLGVSWTVHLWI